MLSSTLDRLVCPKVLKKSKCGGVLRLAFSNRKEGVTKDLVKGDVLSGIVECQNCHAKYPILAGVAVLVDDVSGYLAAHVKGVSQLVDDSEIPSEYRDEFLEAKEEFLEEQVQEHIEEDLEAERIVALYFMNHYLSAKDAESWWKPRNAPASPLIEDMIKTYWDQGPFHQIEKWLHDVSPLENLVELGCGVGGLFPKIHPLLKKNGFYLGIDSSFASIALARHLNLGAPYRGQLRVPEDLLAGPVSREIKMPKLGSHADQVDFVVGDVIDVPVKAGAWDCTIALNTLDMLDDPAQLPKIQHDLLKKHGSAIQSCPYIWHERVVSGLRGRLPKGMTESSRMAEWLYEKAGFKIGEKVEHLPWLFFKHVRQLEIYSVHLFRATRLN